MDTSYANMELSHVLYKVDDLEKAVNKFRRRGFQVIYDHKKEAHHAFIYFKEGPYLEIIQNMAITGFIAFMLNRMGYKKFVRSMQEQERMSPGYIRIAFESVDENFKREKKIYEKYGQQPVVAPVRRKDNKVILKCKCLFPTDGEVPFIKSKFKGNVIYRRNVIHTNGIIGINKVLYRSSVNNIQLINELGKCDILKLEVGNHKIDVEFKE